MLAIPTRIKKKLSFLMTREMFNKKRAGARANKKYLKIIQIKDTLSFDSTSGEASSTYTNSNRETKEIIVKDMITFWRTLLFASIFRLLMRI
jgi:hypothetical protein